MAITSQLRSILSQGDTLIVKWQHAGLLKPSAVKPVLATIEQSLIVKRLGALHPLDIASLRSAIALMLG